MNSLKGTASYAHVQSGPAALLAYQQLKVWDKELLRLLFPAKTNTECLIQSYQTAIKCESYDLCFLDCTGDRAPQTLAEK